MTRNSFCCLAQSPMLGQPESRRAQPLPRDSDEGKSVSKSIFPSSPRTANRATRRRGSTTITFLSCQLSYLHPRSLERQGVPETESTCPHLCKPLLAASPIEFVPMGGPSLVRGHRGTSSEQQKPPHAPRSPPHSRHKRRPVRQAVDERTSDLLKDTADSLCIPTYERAVRP